MGQAFCLSSSCFFIVTSIIFIAAGVTPSILEADPIVSGLDLSSFSFTSFDSPLMF
jgi:hypothetical protein